MKYPSASSKIMALYEKDQVLRERLLKESKLDEDYHTEMRELHNQNVIQLKSLMSRIGFPTISKVGLEAYEAAFIIIQHGIDHPQFLKSCAETIKKEAMSNEASFIHYAYLKDRIDVFENKNQTYGTQFDWDEKGLLSPVAIEDWSQVNVNRKKIGLNTLEDQIKKMRDQAQLTGQSVPDDFNAKKLKYDAWRIEVGWLK